MKHRSTLIASAVLALSGLSASADSLMLNNGREMRGTLVSVANGIVIFTPGNGAVNGFQNAPAAVGAVSPIVELPGGSSQQSPNGAVNGVQTSPVAGVQGLPSTSTGGPAGIPLAALGIALMGLGGLLLRRSDSRT